MRKALGMILVLGSAIVLGSGAANAQTTSACGSEQQLIQEIAELRADLMQYLLDVRSSNMRSLKAQLDKVHQDQRRIQEDDRGRGQQILQIEQQLASSELEPETRPQMEAIRLQLVGGDADKLHAKQIALQSLESDLSVRLQREMQLSEALQRRADALQQAPNR